MLKQIQIQIQNILKIFLAVEDKQYIIRAALDNNKS